MNEQLFTIHQPGDGPQELLRFSSPTLQEGDWLLLVHDGEGERAGFRLTAQGPNFEGDVTFFCDHLSATLKANSDHLREHIAKLEARNARLVAALDGAHQQLADHLYDDGERAIDELYEIRDAMGEALANDKPQG